MRPPAIGWSLIVILIGAVAMPAAEPQPSAPELGSLRVESEAKADFYWEEVLLGSTDAEGVIEIGRIPPGPYAVTVRKPGFLERRQQIVIRSGPQQLDLRLQPEVAETALADSSSSSSSPPPAGQARVFAPVAEAVAVEPESGAAGGGLPVPLSGPLSPLRLGLVIAGLLVIAAGALWIGRQRRRDSTAGAAQRPRVVLAESSPRRGTPSFYEDLKRREGTLDRFVEAGSDPERSTFFELRETDHRIVEEDS